MFDELFYEAVGEVTVQAETHRLRSIDRLLPRNGMAHRHAEWEISTYVA